MSKTSFKRRAEYNYQNDMPLDQMAQKMNYWEMQKSFWKTPAGIVIWFTLLAAIIGGGVLALNVFISPYPVIEFFDANPVAVAPGVASNLSWSVIGASQVEIDHEIGRVGLKGFALVTPTDTKTYTLTAVNGTRNRSVDVKVVVQR